MTTDRQSLIRLYGSDEEPAATTRLAAGPLSVSLTAGVVSGVFWHGLEVVRGIDYPIRDRDWGTALVSETKAELEHGEHGFRYSRWFSAAEGGFEGVFELAGSAAGIVELSVRLTAVRPQQVTRAGFVVLHPLAIAGESLDIQHSDGRVENTAFPRQIMPSHPAADIVGLSHTVGPLSVDMEFAGDVFEMEDQRNWSDASFKTYCRPLTRPYPYDLTTGEEVKQRIVLRLAGTADEQAAEEVARLEIAPVVAGTVPEVQLALDPAWPQVGRLGPAVDVIRGTSIIARIDLQNAEWHPLLSAIAADAPGQLDLEVVVAPDVDDLQARLLALTSRLQELGLVPRHVLVLPASYLRGIQPWHPPPPGATPLQAIEAARRLLPETRIGGGMLTNFTELNRSRPPTEHVDFIAHPISPLVHAADDAAVMAALDTVGVIIDSATALSEGARYRLGLAAIGMRSNPYGAAVADNPAQLRIAMASADPRQRGLFGCAWMIGLVAQTAGSAVESVAVGAPYGPFGMAPADVAWVQPLFDEDPTRVAYPIWHMFRALKRLSGKPRLMVQVPDGIAAVAALNDGAVELVLANLRGGRRSVGIPGLRSGRLLDEDAFDVATHDPLWLDGPPAPLRDARVSLGPFACGHFTLDRSRGG